MKITDERENISKFFITLIDGATKESLFHIAC